MAYADLKDVNLFLPQDKVPMNAMDTGLQLDADRIIRGYVGGVINITELQTWADPDHTPELIRAISGRLIAAAYYAERYAENTNELSAYAQSLYNEAILILTGIREGSIVVIDDSGTQLETTSAGLDNTMFIPNDATTPVAAFTRAQIFG